MKPLWFGRTLTQYLVTLPSMALSGRARRRPHQKGGPASESRCAGPPAPAPMRGGPLSREALKHCAKCEAVNEVTETEVLNACRKGE